MNAVIVAARRGDGGERDRAWAACRRRWMALGWDIYVSDSPGDPFSRSAARNGAARAAGAWDVALIVDADVMLADPAAQAAAARDLALATGKLVYAHDHLSLLTQEGTERVLAGEEPGAEHSDGVRHPSTLSSALAVPRPLWDRVGGYDERFVDWGWEDLALMAACAALGGGTERVEGDAYHLWHPRTREENEGNPHHPANEALGREYLSAMGDPARMRAILAGHRPPPAVS